MDIDKKILILQIFCFAMLIIWLFNFSPVSENYQRDLNKTAVGLAQSNYCQEHGGIWINEVFPRTSGCLKDEGGAKK